MRAASTTNSARNSTCVTERGRIVIVISSLGVGGAERAAIHLANMIAGEGFAVEILTFEAMSARSGAAALVPGIQVHRLHLTCDSRSPGEAMAANWNRLVTLRKMLKQATPALVISFVHVTNVLTLLASFGLKLSVVVCEESEPSASPRSKIWRILRWLSYPLANRLVVHSRGARNWFARVPLIRTRVIANAVPVPEPTPVTDTASRDRVVLSVGRLGFEKGYDLLIQAFAKATHDLPAWRLLILGDGSQRTNLEQVIAQFGLSKRVSLPGVESNPWEFYRTAAIFVSSSRHEGFGIALREAMASGCSVIATDCPSGPREIVADGVNGLIVATGDVDAMAKALRNLIDNEALRENLAANARKVAERFHPDAIKREWIALFHELSIA